MVKLLARTSCMPMPSVASETSSARDGVVSHCADKWAFAPGRALIIFSFVPPCMGIQGKRARKETAICPIVGRLRQVVDAGAGPRPISRGDRMAYYGHM